MPGPMLFLKLGQKGSRIGDIVGRLKGFVETLKGLRMVVKINLHAAHINAANSLKLHGLNSRNRRLFCGKVVTFSLSINSPWPRRYSSIPLFMTGLNFCNGLQKSRGNGVSSFMITKIGLAPIRFRRRETFPCEKAKKKKKEEKRSKRQRLSFP